MGKYEPLARYLEDLPSDSWEAHFAEIEQILGFALPKSAHQYQAWWANQDAGHSQTQGWQAAGFETRELDLGGKHVRFVRVNRRISKPRSENAAKGSPAIATLDELWRKAAKLSGINNRQELEAAAVNCFIEREAGRQLAALGGTMPDAKAPPRRRIVW